MNDLLFNLLKVAIIAAIILIEAVVIPWIKSKTAGTNLAAIIMLIQETVNGAEQSVKGEGQGWIKKAQVMQLVEDYCRKHNIKLTEEQISELIEAAVYTMNAGKGGTVSRVITQ